MAELVAHEVEVPVPPERHRERPDHLVQGDPARGDRRVGRQRAHVVVHLLVHEPEGERLVPDQGLVVGLGVGDALLVVPPVLHGEHQVPHVPCLVGGPLLHHLDPLVGDRHLQPVVEADAALGDRVADARHAAHVLRDGDRPRIQRVHHVVGQHEVGQVLHVGLGPEVLPVVAREDHLQAVVQVHHAGDPVEAEAVELVLLQVEAQVGQQEAEHLPVAVVEEPGVPHPVVPAGARVEVVAVAAVKHVDAVVAVGGGVAVDAVHQDVEAQLVGPVDEGLELLGGAAPRADGKEVGHVVPKRGWRKGEKRKKKKTRELQMLRFAHHLLVKRQEVFAPSVMV